MANSAFNQTQSPYASESAAGLVEEATTGQVAANTDTGETGAKLFVPPSKIPSVALDGSYDALETINGATTPQAVTLDGAGRLILADADGAQRQNFIGFATNDVTGPSIPTVVGTPATFSAGTNSVTAPAGNNLMMYVFDYACGSGQSLPSAMSYNGVSMTRVNTFTSANLNIGLWALPLGTLGSPLVANVVSTGGTGASYVRYSVVIVNNAKQTAPYTASIGGAATTALSVSAVVPASQLTGFGIIAAACRVAATNITTGGVTDIDTSTNTEVSTIPVANGLGFTASSSGSNDNGIIGIIVPTATPATQSVVRRLQTVSGFTGLTPNTEYFLSTTAGAITATPPAARVRVGVALTSSKLLIHEYVTDTQFPTDTQVYNSTAPNNSFTDLDLSSVVGKTRRMVVLRVQTNTAGGQIYSFRRNGDTVTIGSSFAAQGSISKTFSLQTGEAAYVLVPTDSAGIVEWTAYANSPSTVITVEAYW